jgi:hypothetical protein
MILSIKTNPYIKLKIDSTIAKINTHFYELVASKIHRGDQDTTKPWNSLRHWITKENYKANIFIEKYI